MSGEPKSESESWDEFYNGGSLSEYPDIRVVRYFKSRSGFHNTQTVIDLGCGNGRHAIAIARMDYNVLAVDYSREALTRLSNASRKAGVGRKITPSLCDLKNPVQMSNLKTAAGNAFSLASYVLIYGVLDYLDEVEALEVLENVRGLCRQGARLLIAARGELDFCHDNPNRSDGWMPLHMRDADHLSMLIKMAEGWGGTVTIDSRLETFQNIPVGGVRGTLLKEHWLFLEAEAI